MTRGPLRRELVAEPIIGGVALVAAVVAYLAVLTGAVAIIGAAEGMTASFWFGVAIALICYSAAFAVCLYPPPGALSRRAAIAATGLVVAGQTATWGTAVIDRAPNIGIYEPLIATAYAIFVTIIFRNHLRVAWFGFVAGLAVTLLLGPHSGDGDWWTPLETTSLVVVLVVSAASLALTPLLGEIDALAIRRRRLAADDDIEQAAVARREQRIDRIDRRVRPVLENIVETRSITADDVAFARLAESRLRDGIRAPAFDTAAIRDAVWRARARGVSVTLLDDGGLRALAEEDTADFLAELLPLLCAELDALAEGEIIARVAPAGRSPIATVTIVLRGTRRRVEFGCDGRVARVVQV
ncbi:hypothetical protein [Gordonia hydrophobica]|uniref:Uncharacterized protein n=1 Tax=Gordonia hydrophobica TaxID=40516 RepID=A0ABZ2TWK1_9ACTN|nr:hypothetical protein [Gordonia hydrophobica]MBM7369280.1 hypothetical protein [Gordonia hydrophobica]